MRYKFLLLLFYNLSVYAQKEVTSISNNFVFKDGIYTSFDELIHNNPKYENCKFEMTKPPVGYPKLFYYSANNSQLSYNDYLFAVVNHGTLFLWFRYSFYHQYYLGQIGIFYETDWHAYSQSIYNSVIDKQCILDFKSGKVLKLDQKSIIEIISKDLDVSQDSLIKIKKKTKSELIPLIMKFNESHTMYIN